MAKRGRPGKYSEKLASEILARLASGESLSSICAVEEMPAASTVSSWNTDNSPPGFSERYARARRDGIYARLDKAHDDLASDDGKTYTDETGNRRVDSGAVQLAKTYADLIKWEASKMLPEYADKQQVEHSGGMNLTGFFAEVAAKRGNA